MTLFGPNCSASARAPCNVATGMSGASPIVARGATAAAVPPPILPPRVPDATPPVAIKPSDPADPLQKRVAIINTGGTIGMKPDASGALEPSPGYLAERVAAMHEFKRPEMPATYLYELLPLLDSSDMGPEDWARIATTVEHLYYEYDGFVIVMGTDTMAYCASALSFLFEHLNKTVILTGAMLPLVDLFNDGRRSLIVSVILSCTLDIPEVRRTHLSSLADADAMPPAGTGSTIALRSCLHHHVRCAFYCAAGVRLHQRQAAPRQSHSEGQLLRAGRVRLPKFPATRAAGGRHPVQPGPVPAAAQGPLPGAQARRDQHRCVVSAPRSHAEAEARAAAACCRWWLFYLLRRCCLVRSCCLRLAFAALCLTGGLRVAAHRHGMPAGA